jgi:hypothetical protein
MGLLTGQEGRRKKSTFTDADLKKYAGITREELGEMAKIPPAPTPVPRYLNNRHELQHFLIWRYIGRGTHERENRWMAILVYLRRIGLDSATTLDFAPATHA